MAMRLNTCVFVNRREKPEQELKELKVPVWHMGESQHLTPDFQAREDVDNELDKQMKELATNIDQLRLYKVFQVFFVTWTVFLTTLYIVMV